MEDVIVLDTDILLDFLGNRETAAVTEDILTAGRGAVASVTVYELFRGVESRKHLEQRKRLFSYLHVLDLSSPIAAEAGKMYTFLRKRGSTTSNEDILIGATCIYHSMSLFTGNRRHFESIPGLRIYEG